MEDELKVSACDITDPFGLSANQGRAYSHVIRVQKRGELTFDAVIRKDSRLTKI